MRPGRALRRLVLPVAALALAAGGPGLSGANFTATLTTPASFSTGPRAGSPPARLEIRRPAAGAVLGTARPRFVGRAGRAHGDGRVIVLRVHPGATTAAAPLATYAIRRRGRSWQLHPRRGRPLPDGPHTAQAEQRDAAGARVRSAPVTFRIDTSRRPRGAAGERGR